MAPPANYFSSSVQFVSSTAAPVVLPLMKWITGIKYFPGSSAGYVGVNSSAAILSGAGSSTGMQLWLENSQGPGHVTDMLSIYDPDGVTVSLGGGATVFIYGRVSRGS